jgi:oligopeptide/dipeptide ABC transporter ATP-binding protein
MNANGSGGAPLVRLRGVSVYYRLRGGLFGSVLGSEQRVRAVDGVSLDIAAGETLGLVGESGSGKTTLGRAVLRLVEPTAGTVEFEGRDITHLPERQLRPLRRRMQPVFQDPHAALNPAMTIGEAVAHPLKVQGLCDDRHEARRRAGEMLERVGVTPAGAFLDRYPEDLSGGQKQRVVLARALVTGPRLVVADEPVAMLDMSVRALVLRLLVDLRRDLGLTYVFITHDLATARLLCDRVAVMYLGRVVEAGPAEAVLSQPRHPYTRALLEAVPRPEPSARRRPRRLPAGEVPDAIRPPAGCRFHPRCPDAFAACGWEGRDLVDFLEAGGDLDAGRAELIRDGVRFGGAGAELAERLEAWRAERAHPLFEAVASIERVGSGVEVRFGPGPEPALQAVGPVDVACHLYGVTDAAAATD